ncbi:UNVERIFIED_CONTAM: hypothetical protein Slati_1206100 [Sesamum latifolium]|uniref:Uncharacterized protein n=1 Tax=Sesamum latifolium TaxID=2727402 RepID=A0AAW2XK68_9LAMI
MAATALLFRPNVTALRLVSSRACALSFMRRTASMRTATKSYSSGRSLFAGGFLFPAFRAPSVELSVSELQLTPKTPSGLL